VAHIGAGTLQEQERAERRVKKMMRAEARAAGDADGGGRSADAPALVSDTGSAQSSAPAESRRGGDGGDGDGGR
jgi:hypothetical protein